MKIGYGYRRTEKALRDAGAERVWIDLSKERTERADMVSAGLRAGDTLVLLSIRDLGGSAKADAMWKENIEAMGVTVEVCEPVDEQEARPVGRPKKFDPTPEQDDQIRKLWLCWHYTEAYKVRRVAEIMGHEVKRGVLFHRYGSMSKPKKEDS